MASFFEKLHPLVLIPVLLILWLCGSTILMLLLSALNAPGVNEHGSGLLLVIFAWFCGVIAALVHALVLLRSRHGN